MNINPIYQKELRTSMRTIKTVFIILGYNALLALFALFAFYVSFHYNNKYEGVARYADILGVYSIIAISQFGLLLFLIPALTATAIAGERERQTLEILLTTNISPLRIIVGKLTSSISMMIILAISSLPILGLVFAVGGITFKDLLQVIVLIFVTGIYIGSIGIFFSCLYKKTSLATVFSYGTVLFLTAGTWGIIWGIARIYELNARAISDTITYYNISPDIGNWLLLLIMNPAITCYSVIESQIGSGEGMLRFFGNYGIVDGWIMDNWFLISILIQLVMSAILIMLSARLLDPLKKKGK